MDYLFYDIECSDGRHMCSFGYVITDEHFVIKKKEDVLINPEAIFHTGAWGKKQREKDPGIELAYPEKEFRASPKFPFYYEYIKNLICAPDRTIIGFSHHNDVLFLSAACKKYSLPIITYKFFDAQEMYGESHNVAHQVALNTIAETYKVDLSSFVPHRSDDDAEASMLVMKAMCEDMGLSIEGLIAKSPRAAGEVNGEGHCIYYVREALREEKRRKALQAHNTRSTQMSNRNLAEFRLYIRTVMPNENLEQTFSGKRVTVSSAYEYRHYKEISLIAKSIIERGGKYTRVGSEVDIYVKAEKGKRCVRFVHVKNAIAAGKSIEIIDLSELLDRLSLTEKDLENADFPVIPEGTQIPSSLRKRRRKKKKKTTQSLGEKVNE